MLKNHLEKIKLRCGIVSEINVYDEEISSLLEDCEQDMLAAGVTSEVMNDEEHLQQLITAATLYVKAHLGNDRTDTAIYMSMYRNKVFRLTLEGMDGVE